MSQEFPGDFGTDPFSLPEVHQHMIRSPPPTSWPRSPNFKMFRFPADSDPDYSQDSSNWKSPSRLSVSPRHDKSTEFLHEDTGRGSVSCAVSPRLSLNLRPHQRSSSGDTKVTLGVQITSLEVPAEVRNGSGAAVLDCEYSLRAEEVGLAGLVVKWFWNNSPAPVYQWIPGQRPQDLGVLKGRLDLLYRASEHPATMHRALYITNPTPKLSGEYKCAVSTFYDEDFMIKKMVVYAPERVLTIMYSRADFETVNVSCYAEGVYPEPKINLYILAENKTKLPVHDAVMETTARSGEYDIKTEALLADTGLDTPTVFLCELHIPETTYRNSKTITYYPAMADSSSTLSARALLVFTIFSGALAVSLALTMAEPSMFV